MRVCGMLEWTTHAAQMLPANTHTHTHGLIRYRVLEGVAAMCGIMRGATAYLILRGISRHRNSPSGAPRTTADEVMANAPGNLAEGPHGQTVQGEPALPVCPATIWPFRLLF